MSQPELLTRVVRVLEDRGIEYMVTGSIASSLHGQPRSTHDVDLVVALREGDVPALLQAFPSPAFYVSETAIRDAIRHGSMFNRLSTTEGDKVDFWLLTEEPFDRSRFERRLVQEYRGLGVHFSTPEDTILVKLSWAKRSGGSERHVQDALAVYEVQREGLDVSYLDEWARVLGVVDLLDGLRSAAEPEPGFHQEGDTGDGPGGGAQRK